MSNVRVAARLLRDAVMLVASFAYWCMLIAVLFGWVPRDSLVAVAAFTGAAFGLIPRSKDGTL